MKIKIRSQKRKDLPADDNSYKSSGSFMVILHLLQFNISELYPVLLKDCAKMRCLLHGFHNMYMIDVFRFLPSLIIFFLNYFLKITS